MVELGGGCGLGGIAIAHACGAHVTITGACVPPLLPPLFPPFFSRGISCFSTPPFAADTSEVCENILSNVRLNADLQPPPPAPSPACNAAAACSLSGDVYRASYGSITVLPLTWGGADVPLHLHVPRPAPQHV